MKNLTSKISLLGAVLCLCQPSSVWADTYSFTGTSGSSWTTAGDWYDVTTSTAGAGYPGGTASTADVVDLGQANATVVLSSTLVSASDTIAALNFTSSALSDLNELDITYQTTGPTVPSLLVSSGITVGSGTAGTGTEEIYLNPASATSAPVVLDALGGITVQTGGVLELGSNAASSGQSYLGLGTGTTNTDDLIVNGGTVDIDRPTASGTGQSEIGYGTGEGLFELESGSLVIGNESSTSTNAASAAATLYENSNFAMTGGSIVAGADGTNTSALSIQFLGNTSYIEGGTLSSSVNYSLHTGASTGTHLFESDVTVPNFTVYQYGTYTDQIGAFNNSTLNLGSLTIQEEHASGSFNGIVQLVTNVAMTSGSTMITANDAAPGTGYTNTNTIDLAGNTLDLTAVGTGATTFTPNNSNNNIWQFASSSGTGTVKAYAFNFSSAYEVTAPSTYSNTSANSPITTPVNSAVVFRATGGNGSVNNLGYNASGVNGSLAGSTFQYSGNATVGAATSAQLISNRTIGSLAVTSGGLLIDQASLTAAGGLTVTGGTLGFYGTSSAATIGSLTLGLGQNLSVTTGGTLDFLLTNAGTSDEVFGNNGSGSGGSFTLNGATLALSGAINYSDTYDLFNDFASGSISNLAITGYNTTLYDATLNSAGQLSFVSAPEPSTWVMLGLGGLLLLGYRRRFVS